MKKQYHSMTMSIHITICASGNFFKIYLHILTEIDSELIIIVIEIDWQLLSILCPELHAIARWAVSWRFGRTTKVQ